MHRVSLRAKAGRAAGIGVSAMRKWGEFGKTVSCWKQKPSCRQGLRGEQRGRLGFLPEGGA